MRIMDEETLLLLHSFAAAYMTGIIWIMQLVHYPLYECYSKEIFAEAIRRHMFRISVAVMPAMLLEMTTGIWLALYPPSGTGLMIRVLFLLLIVCWISTVSVQARCHKWLLGGYDKKTLRLLVFSNWIRTICWTVRSIVLFWLLFEMLPIVAVNS